MSLRVAGVGAGYFSQFHYDSWARMDRARAIAACDRDIAKARATGLKAYADLDAMLAAEAPDLLDIILPPDAHAEAIRTALVHDIPNIICQKPFCRSLDEARAATEAAEAKGTTLIVHENFRFQPWYRAIAEMLAGGLVGELQQVTFRLRPGDGQGPRAYLDRQPYFQTMPRFLIHETGVHWIDVFRFLLGDPLAVYADLRQVNPVLAGEDAGFVLFDHPGGVRALLDGNRCLDHAADNTRRTMGEALIEGLAGTLDLHGDGSVWLRAFGMREAELRLPPDTYAGFGGDCVHHLQRHVVSGLLDGTALENTAQDYLKVIETEQAVYRSAGTGAKIRLHAS